LHASGFYRIPHLTKYIGCKETKPVLLMGVKAVVKRLPSIRQLRQRSGPLGQVAGPSVHDVDEINLGRFIMPASHAGQALLACRQPPTDGLLYRWPVSGLFGRNAERRLEDVNSSLDHGFRQGFGEPLRDSCRGRWGLRMRRQQRGSE
jgi:hypothetical protein